MKYINSSLAKVILVAILLIGVVSALEVDVQDPVETIYTGEVAQYNVEITNTGSEEEQVEISARSKAKVTLSESEIVLMPGESREIKVFALSEDLEEGAYSVTLEVNDIKENLALIIEEGKASLRLSPVYERVTIEQGTSQRLTFVARNTGERDIENIVVKSELSDKFNPQYPDSFRVEQGDSREFSIVVDVPRDYPTGEYKYRVTVGSGNLEVREDIRVNIVDTLPLKGRLTLDVLKPWEKLVEDGENIGYRVPVETTNKGLVDIDGVKYEVEGAPADWEIQGTEEFEIKGGQVIQTELKIDAQGDFSPRTINVNLVKDGVKITSEQIELEGDKVGAPVGITGRVTGMVTGGFGSLTLGVIVLIALVAIFLYVRERNLNKEFKEKKSDKKYLEKLVEKTVEEDKPSDKKEEN